ncbi:MAG: UDP-N-acetylmuramoyl-L-alanine--D-glutamate ligase [Acetobacteraceae bacterium]|nr:UDP-N-acetylmuramoyl-L-alanine--D-glutamate ligase [Acetobacteraceae bacterium]
MRDFAPDLFADRRYAVVGLGRNGLPAARSLAAMGALVTAWDDEPAMREAAQADGLTVRDPLSGCFAFDALILSPGIAHRLPTPHPIAQRAIRAGVPVLSDAELLFQAVRRAGSRARFVGITGTNGKSTTTALLAHILRCAGVAVAAGGNLGPAALALPLLADSGVYVLEMSSYMLERIATLRFDAAAMLNLSADHLDRHGDMKRYASAKRAIFDRQEAGDLAVIGVDDAGSRAMLAWRQMRAGHVVAVSGNPDPGRPDEDERVVGPLARADWTAGSATLPGAHNRQNAAAAAAIALYLGLSCSDIRRAVAGFPGLAHRQQRVGVVDGIAFINDSKATNADAAARALGCYDRIVWIAGGIAKDGGIAPLARYFPRIARALLIGRDAALFASTLRSHGVAHDILGTLEDAVPAAYAAARSLGADVVLLSPASASFDQFSGFEARGERFASLVCALALGRVV